MFRWCALASVWLIVVAITASLARAVTIDIHLAPDSDSPSFDASGAKLLAIIGAAADYWEDIIEDPYSVDVEVGYKNVGGNEGGFGCLTQPNGECYDGVVLPAAPSTAAIAFDTLNPGGMEQPWFFDQTPNEHSEFSIQQTLVGNLSNSNKSAYYTGIVPDLLEAGFLGGAVNGGPADDRIDAYSVALHELGHILGLINEIAQPESMDGDYDVSPAFVHGATMAVRADPGASDHLADSLALMRTTVGTSVRLLPSATDVFAIASGANPNWTSIDLKRKDFFAGATWDTAGNWEGGRVPDSGDDVFVRHGGNVELLANRPTGNLLVADGSSVDTNDKTLTVSGPVRIGDGGTLQSAGSIFGTAVNAQSLEVETGGTITGTGRFAAGDIVVSGDIVASTPAGSLMDVLVLDATGAGEIDLDGDGGGRLFALNASILVSGPLADSFEGQFTIGPGRTIFFDEPWTFGPLFPGAVGQINLQGGAGLAQAATLDTDAWTARRGLIIASGVSQIIGPVTLFGDIDVQVAAGGILNFNSPTSFQGGSYTGDGTIVINANTTIDSATVVDVHQFDLDGNSFGQTLTLNAPLTLNVDRVDTGNNVFNTDTIELNFNSGLAVNLPDDDAWTMGGTLNINLGLITQTVLRGSPVLVTGTIHADGSSRITAAVDLAGDLVTEDAGTRVTLSGPSGIRVQRHVIRGEATVSGPGVLAVDASAVLQLEDGATLGVDLENAGELEVGASPGQATINGDYLQSAQGAFTVELGGPPASDDYDVLHVLGQATLGGSLNIRLIDGFLPAVDAQFEVLTAMNVVGVFSGIAAQNGLDVSVLYSATHVIVQIDAAFLPGDYNRNGTIDTADYVVWRNTLGQNGFGLAADGNGNNQIDDGDYVVWKLHYGQTTGSGLGASANATVPGPATLTLIILALAGWSLQRRGPHR